MSNYFYLKKEYLIINQSTYTQHSFLEPFIN